ncbi:YadA-like family protein [Luteimonas abyssi]|uniref:YadA-like family protein n=1 Tax=Luteimonas abyssi TaxID=1247514 RepID=UPI000737D384|nr:YadA-like family protein [Luteimonas abyssi]
MNRIFKKVWNRTLRQLVVASEFASGDRGAGPGAVTRVHRGGPALGVLGLAMLAVSPVQAVSYQAGTGAVAEACQGAWANQNNPGIPNYNDNDTSCAVAVGFNAFSGNGNGAGNGGTAIGANARATSTGVFGSTALGANANAANAGVAVGAHATATGTRAIALGRQSAATGTEAIGIGSGSYAQGGSSIAMGAGAHAQGTRAVAIGTRSSTWNSTLIAQQTRADGSDAIAIGGGATRGTQATGANALALGAQTTATGVSTTAIGSSAQATAAGAVAMGEQAAALGQNAVALGGAMQNATTPLAAADAVRSTGIGSVAIGANALSGAQSTAADAIAIGGGARASAANTIAMGRNARALLDSATALGNSASALSTGSVAFGSQSNVAAAATSGTAIGTSAIVSHQSAVALGAGSQTAAVVATPNTVIAGTTYTFAGATPTATVSVGNASLTRTITNVGAGRINATSTDAINGSQLHATNQAVDGVAQDVNALGVSVANGFGGTSSYDPGTGAVTTGLTVNGTGHTSVQSALDQLNGDANAGWNVSAQGANGTNVGVNSATGNDVDLNNADGNIVVSKADDSNDVTFDLADDLNVAGSITVGDTVIDGDSVTTTNLTTTGTTQLGDSFTVDAGGARYDGPITDATHIVNKSYVDDSVTALADTPLTFAGDAGTNVDRQLGETVNLVGGAADETALTDGNIGVVANGTDTLEIKLNKDIDLGDDGSLAIGDTSISNDGLTIVGGPSITNAGIDAGGLVISNVAPGVAGTDAANMNQLNDVADIANAGWNVSAQGANGTNVGVNSATGNDVDLNNADGNIVVSKAGDSNDVTFDLADDLNVAGSVNVGDTSITNDGLTIVGGPSITNAGIDAGGLVIGNVAPGVAGTDAANMNQLNDVSDIANAGWNVSAQGANGTNVGVNSATGNDVDLNNADGNIVVTKADDSNDVTFDLADDLNVAGSITVGDTVIDGDSVTTTNLTTTGTTQLGDSFTVDAGGARYDGPITDGTHIVNKNYVDDSIGELADTPLTFAGDAGTNVERQLGQTVNLVGGATDEAALTDGNIGVVANGTDTLEIKLNKDIDLGDDGSLAIGDTSISNDGLTIVGGPSITNAGIDAGGLVISNVAPGVAGTDAANMNQLNDVADIANAGWNVSAQGANGTNVGVNSATGNDVDLNNADGNIVVSKAGDSNDVTFDLADDLNVAGSVNVGDTSITNDGLTIVGGPSITNAGIDAGGLVIGNVAPGVAGTDAANMNQLNDVSDIANAGWNVSAQGANGTNVGVNSATGNDVDLNNADGNIVVTKADDSNDVTFDLADDLNVAGSITVGDTVIDGDSVTTTNLTTTGTTQLGDSFTVDAGGARYDGPITDGTHIVNKNYVDDSIGELADTPLTFAGDAGTNVERQLGQTVNLVGGATDEAALTDGNIGVVANGDDTLEIKLNKDIDLGADGSVAIGATSITNDGLTIVGGPSITVGGIDAGGNRITNVADGQADSDAATVGQVTDAIDANRTRYYSVNSTGGGNFDNDGATGEDAIAAGKDAEAEGDDAIALGRGAIASDEGAVAVGADAQAAALNSMAIGAGAVASHANSIALGAGSATTVGAQTGYDGAFVGTSSSTGEVNVGGRQITGVAAGSADTDAVNVSQLQAGVQNAVETSNAYTDSQIGQVNTRIDEIDGRVTNIEGDITDIRGDITSIDGRVTDIEGTVENITVTIDEFDGRVTDIENGASGAFQVKQGETYVAPTPTGSNASAGGNGARASGDNSTAIGNQAVASGDNSTAIGQGATASHANSVALGQGSATTVGAQASYEGAYVGNSSSTGEVNVGGRTISGVAPGRAGTDAVNVNQLNAGVDHAITQSNLYTDSRIGQIQEDMWTMERGYRGATASAMAMAGLPQAYLPGKSMLAVGVGGYQSEYGMAVGLSGITDNGRYVYRAQASGNTARDWGFSVGAGIQW